MGNIERIHGQAVSIFDYQPHAEALMAGAFGLAAVKEACDELFTVLRSRSLTRPERDELRRRVATLSGSGKLCIRHRADEDGEAMAILAALSGAVDFVICTWTGLEMAITHCDNVAIWEYHPEYPVRHDRWQLVCGRRLGPADVLYSALHG